MKKLLSKFTTYEKVWWLTVTVIAIAAAVIFPEEDVNGHNGTLILGLQLLYTVLNVTCELLISKQSAWNFIVSIFIEINEIAIFLLLAARFATMATVVLFWIPMDIASFILWKDHPDKENKALTEVRALSGWKLLAVIGGIIVWTAGIGSLLCYITDNLTVTTLFNGNRNIEIIVCYLDAMVSALDICNGTFILLRFREQWFAWYLEVIFDAVIWILSGQYFMLILTLGYLSNTTYGFIKWTRYAKEHKTKTEYV